jgi:V8-like Glu-specific endopeptidase
MYKYIENLAYLLSLFTFTLVSINASETNAQPKLEHHRQAIRNGNISPTNVQLTPNQLKAIGWLFTGSNGRFCTATVISESTILTAKHCFFGNNAPDPNSEFYFGILADQNDENPFLYEDRFGFNINDVITFNDLDLAIISFAMEPFLRSNLTPIPINTYPLEGVFRQNLTYSFVDVAGYGETQHDNEEGRHFASVKIDLITAIYVITNGQYDQGICQGDSGGPLLTAGHDGEVSILAIVTNGDKCCVGYDQLTRVDLEAKTIVQLGKAYTSSGNQWPYACRGVYKRNTCRGDILKSCFNDEVVDLDCKTINKTCAYHPSDQRFDCMDRFTLACSIPPEGRCIDSVTLERCEYGETRIISCENSICSTLGDGKRLGCVGEIPNFNFNECDEDNPSRLAWASEAKFTASSGCTHRQVEVEPLLIPWIFLLIYIRKKPILTIT